MEGEKLGEKSENSGEDGGAETFGGGVGHDMDEEDGLGDRATIDAGEKGVEVREGVAIHFAKLHVGIDFKVSKTMNIEEFGFADRVGDIVQEVSHGTVDRKIYKSKKLDRCRMDGSGFRIGGNRGSAGE